MLLELREIQPEALPINFLLPIKGTPLGDADISILTTEYCMKVLCLARLLVPKADILIQKKADENYYGQKASKTDAADMESSLRGKHILLAEDNELNAEIAIAILEETGLIIDRVEDGIQCVDRIEQMPAGTYDMILIDIQMPNMDGYEATKCIRHLQDIKKAEIPIIAMTANAFQEDAEKCIAVGMNAHLAKTLDIEKVEQTICKQVRDAKMKNRI